MDHYSRTLVGSACTPIAAAAVGEDPGWAFGILSAEAEDLAGNLSLGCRSLSAGR